MATPLWPVHLAIYDINGFEAMVRAQVAQLGAATQLQKRYPFRHKCQLGASFQQRLYSVKNWGGELATPPSISWKANVSVRRVDSLACTSFAQKKRVQGLLFMTGVQAWSLAR